MRLLHIPKNYLNKENYIYKTNNYEIRKYNLFLK